MPPRCHDTTKKNANAMPSSITLHVPLQADAHIIIRPPSTQRNQHMNQRINLSLDSQQVKITMTMPPMTTTGRTPVQTQTTTSTMKTRSRMNAQTQKKTQAATTSGCSTTGTSFTTEPMAQSPSQEFGTGNHLDQGIQQLFQNLIGQSTPRTPNTSL